MEWMIENKQRKWNRTFAENLLPLHPRLYLRWSLFLFDHIRIAKKWRNFIVTLYYFRASILHYA